MNLDEHNPFDMEENGAPREAPVRSILPGLSGDLQDDVDWAEHNDPEGEAAERRKDLRIVIVWAVIVMVLLVAGVLYLLLRKTRIPLDPYVTIRTEGIETIGTAEAVFDTAAFIDDYKETIRFRRGKANTKVGDFANAAEALLAQCVSGSLNRDKDLSEGDRLTYVWDCDDAAAAENYHCILQYTNIDHTVGELDKPGTFDPFDGIAVDYVGIAPEGAATVRRTSQEEIYQSVQYTVSPQNDLKNGDRVKVTVSLPDGGDVAESTLRAFGKIPSALEKQYVVGGLTTYAVRLDEIPTEALESMRAKAEQVFTETEVPTWNRGATLVNREYLGSYLLVPNGGNADEIERVQGEALQLLGEYALQTGLQAAGGNALTTERAPFGYSGEGTQEGEEQDGNQGSGFHWSDLLDPAFYGFGSGQSGQDQGDTYEDPEDAYDAAPGPTPRPTVTPTPTPTPTPQESNWYGFEDLLHTAEYEDDRENILYLVYRVDVAVGASQTFSYYTYTAFSDIRVQEDGGFAVDLEDYHVPTGSRVFGVTSGDVVGVRVGWRTYYFSGFASVEDLYRRCVYEHLDAYTYESGVSGY